MSSGPLRVDASDLEGGVWTCSNYSHLYATVPSSPCSEVLPDAIKFRTHIRRCHKNGDFPKQFLCPVTDCNQYTKVWTRFQFLRNHYDCMHRDAQPYTCSVCTKSFSSRKTWKRHYTDCSTGLISCSQCDRKFSGHSSLSRHVKEKHTKEGLAVRTIPTNAGAELISRLVRQIQATIGAAASHSSELGNSVIIETSRAPSSPSPSTQPSQHSPSRESSPASSPQKRRRTEWEQTGWDSSQEGGDSGYYGRQPNYWNEFSTQTVTEHNSFGTQTLLCSEDPFALAESDFVEYLDGEVQTERVDSASFASQTGGLMAEVGRMGCGGPTSDRDCQTSWYTNSIQTQTKVRKERPAGAGTMSSWLNTETQTVRPGPSLCSETQTMDF